MPQATPFYFFFILLSVAFVVSQLLMALLLYTDDLLKEIDIFRSLVRQGGGVHIQVEDTCDKEDSNILKTEPDKTNKRHCGKGYFQLEQDGEGVCHPMLTCEDIADITVINQIGGGAVKQVFLAERNGHKVVFSNLTQSYLAEDFLHGANMLQEFQPSDLVVKLLGSCPAPPVIITEYHHLGSPENINDILLRKGEDNLATKFRLCIDYVRILHFLHNSPVGTRVMCDSNDLVKTLSQFLVTSDLHLVINDVDALPLVDSSNGIFIKCGHREIFGEFVAPEQLWPFSGTEFNDDLMPGYGEQTDIWKMVDVVDYLLGDDTKADVVRFHLFKLHAQCRTKDPGLRPTAAQILKVYLEIQQQLMLF